DPGLPAFAALARLVVTDFADEGPLLEDANACDRHALVTIVEVTNGDAVATGFLGDAHHGDRGRGRHLTPRRTLSLRAARGVSRRAFGPDIGHAILETREGLEIIGGGEVAPS